MVKQVIREITTIIGRELTGLERMRVRSKVLTGMVNPYDVANALGLK